ncbi:MAG: hypothetical protein LUC36_04400 [Oscillospiraceae bacterium]|nr:hypothetical protein [Oscillospiraceae bacterium]
MVAVLAVVVVAVIAKIVIAVLFVYCALANPGLGRVFYIGGFKVDAGVKRIFYAVYAAAMAVIFVLSFFVENSSRKK